MVQAERQIQLEQISGDARSFFERVVQENTTLVIEKATGEQIQVKPLPRKKISISRIRPSSPAELEQVYQSVPALASPLSFDEMREIAREEHLQEVTGEGHSII